MVVTTTKMDGRCGRGNKDGGGCYNYGGKNYGNSSYGE